MNSILLVDDSEFTNIFNTRLLKRIHAARHIYAVKDGQEALHYLLKNRDHESNADRKNPIPDLILLDINMPVMDGWEFLREFDAVKHRHKDIFEDIVIIVLTTSPNPDDEKKARSIMHVDDYFLKPISEKMIEEIITRHFMKSSKARGR